MFFQDFSGVSSPADETLTWKYPVAISRANEHQLTLRNDSDANLTYSATALSNDYLYLAAGGAPGTPGVVGVGQEKLLFSGRTLAAGDSTSLPIAARLTDDVRKSLGDKYDAALLPALLRFDTTRSTPQGTVDAGAATLRMYYFRELTNLNQADGVLSGAPLRAGETRKLLIYNPDRVAIETEGRWVASTEGNLTTLTLVTNAQDRGLIESSLVFKLNNEVYSRAVVSTVVRATQQLNVNVNQLTDLITKAVTIAHTSVADSAFLTGNDLAIYNLLSGGGVPEALPADLDSADLAQMVEGLKAMLGSGDSLGVFGKELGDGALQLSFATASSLDNKTRERTTSVDFGLDLFGNSGEAGRAGWDFLLNQMNLLLTTSTGAVTNEHSIRSKEYVLSRLINTTMTGAINGDTASVSVPNALRQAVAAVGGIADRGARMDAIGRYFGWLAAHESAHNLGLPDEYRLDSLGNATILVSGTTFMGSPNVVERSIEQSTLLDLALADGDRNPTLDRLQADNLIFYMQALAKKERYLGAPPVTSGSGGSGTSGNTPGSGAGGGSSAPNMGGASTPNFCSGLPAFPTLLNGALTLNDSWSTSGAVQVGNGQAVLTESSSRQTRMAQCFMIRSNDRLLSFTVTATGLVDNGRGPGDAFEVALLDVNTGRTVAGSVDLIGSDALLNLQTNGRERLATTVRKQPNADGSATYFVSLAPELDGRAMLLSFDLIGFAATQSYVNLRDIRLLSAALPPELNNNGPVNEGSSVTISYTNLPNAADAHFSFATSILGLAGTYAAAGTNSSTSFTFPDNGNYQVYGRILKADNTFSDFSTTVVVDNVAPKASLSNNGPVAEGSPVTVSLNNVVDPSATDVGATFRYSFANTAGGLAVTYAAASANNATSFTFADNGNYTIYGRVFDKDGGFTDYTTPVAVNNVAPTAVMNNNGPVTAGSLVTVNLTSPLDPSATDTNAGFRYSFSTTLAGLATSYSTASFNNASSFTIASAGTFTLYGRIWDKDGGFTNYSTSILVNPVAPVDVTSKVSVRYYGAQYNTRTKTYAFYGTLTNNSNDTLRGPIQLAWSNILPSTALASGNTGSWSDGSPYFDFSGFLGSDGLLTPGEVSQPRTFAIKVVAPGAYSFTTRVTGVLQTNGGSGEGTEDRALGLQTPLSLSDSLAPESHIASSPDRTSTNDILVAWGGADEAYGSGIANFDIYVSRDAGPYSLWMPATDLLSAQYHGDNGHAYSFYCVARDHAGNLENAPVEMDMATEILFWPKHNPLASVDVNNDGQVSPLDALLVINNLNVKGSRSVLSEAISAPYVDTSGDNQVSPLDALLVINYLNHNRGAGEGEATANGRSRLTSPLVNQAVDSFFDALAWESEDLRLTTQGVGTHRLLGEWSNDGVGRSVSYRLDPADRRVQRIKIARNGAAMDWNLDESPLDAILDEIVSEWDVNRRLTR